MKQYELAWKHGVFEKMFASKAMVQSHYFYSGGNMRLMLMSEQACLEVLRTSFASVTDPQLLLSGLHGQSSFSAVNTLFNVLMANIDRSVNMCPNGYCNNFRTIHLLSL